MEKKLAEGKAELQERKEEVRGLIEEMNVMSRDLAARMFSSLLTGYIQRV